MPFWGLRWIQQKVLVERQRNARQLEELRSEAEGGERWSWSIFLQCSFAIQWRCLSTSNCSELISINGIFLLSHSIRFSFSQILLDCPSEAFSIGLLNNANAPLPYMDLCPPFLPPALHLPPTAAFTSSVPSERRPGTMTYFILRNVHHPVAALPRGSLPPTFLI